MPSEPVKALREKFRTALADYMATEGCSCCEDREGHEAAAVRLGKLLRIPQFSDKSGYDFQRYCTRRGDAE